MATPSSADDGIATYEVDVNNDGVYDVTFGNEADISGVLSWYSTSLAMLGIVIDDGIYPAKLRVSSVSGKQATTPFSIYIGNTAPRIEVPDPKSLGLGQVWDLMVSNSSSLNSYAKEP